MGLVGLMVGFVLCLVRSEIGYRILAEFGVSGGIFILVGFLDLLNVLFDFVFCLTDVADRIQFGTLWFVLFCVLCGVVVFGLV